MKFIADLHIHSKYARAVSPRMTLPELDRWASDKGILVMGTGDFTHPLWYSDMTKQLEEAEPGLYRLKQQYKLPTIRGVKAETRFMLTSEVSCIYTRGGRGRRVHALLYAPDLAAVKKINQTLAARGCNLKSDGRPIFGLDIIEILKIVMSADPESVLIPAHVWTPWFSIFGSKSGFNSTEECFGDYTKYIFAMETGLSSDPMMNCRWSALDNIALISNSDSHSLERIGREANIFNTELSYAGVMGALKNAGSRFLDKLGMTRGEGLLATIEYFPEEGMYHVDGHRKCGVSYLPAETERRRSICRVCHKPVTVGVLNRINKLADRTEEEVARETKNVIVGEVTGRQFRDRPAFINLVTLDTIIAESLGVGEASKKVKAQYDLMLKKLGSELDILMSLPLESLKALGSDLHPAILEALRRVRQGGFSIKPGFDGEYGTVRIFKNEEKEIFKVKTKKLKTLFD